MVWIKINKCVFVVLTFLINILSALKLEGTISALYGRMSTF